MGARGEPGLSRPYRRVHAKTQREGGEKKGEQEESCKRGLRRLRRAREQEEEGGGE